VLKLFLDDTGTHKGSEVVGVGGLIGGESAWEDFLVRWQSVLDSPFPDKPPLRKWSSFDCRWGLGEFSNYNQAERDRITYRFRDVLTQSNLFGISNMVDGEAWKEIIAKLGSENISTAEATALYRALTRMQNWISTQPGGPDLAVYYDAGRADNPEIHKLAKLLGNENTAFSHIVGFTFLPVIGNPPLQGADMIATESYWYAQEWLKHGSMAVMRPHMAAYLKDNFEKGNGEILDRSAIMNMKMTQFLEIKDGRFQHANDLGSLFSDCRQSFGHYEIS